MDFLFGSIASLIVVCLYGTAWGTVVAAITGFHTFVLWGHPYAAIILTLEALFVGGGGRRKQQNILLLDGFYWICIGMPLVWLFYAEFMGVQAQTVWLVMLKQSINGIFNALIASLLLTHLPVRNWVVRRKSANTFSLQLILFNLLVAFVLFPALTLVVLNSRSAMSNIERTIEANLQHASTEIATELHLWHQQNLNALTQLAQVTARSEMSPSRELQESTELLQRTFPIFNQIFVVDREGKTVVSSPQLDQSSTDKTKWKLIEAAKQEFTSNILLINDGTSSPKLVYLVPVNSNNRFLGNAVSEIKLEFIEQIVKSFVSYEEMEITLLDSQERVIASTHYDVPILTPFDPHHGGKIHPINTKIYQWLPLGKMPLMMRWKNSFYVQRTAISQNFPLTIIVETPTKPHFLYLQNLYIKSLAIMLALAVIALILANSLSRWLAKPILQLAEVTTDLPDKLLEQKAIIWPKSWVMEMRILVGNFQLMAALLEQKFQEINKAKEQLEQRVKERTQELSDANRELVAEVTERKRVAESLQQSEVLLRAQTRKLKIALEELKQTQAQLVQTEKMSSLGQLVAGVAHEINNPVNFIYGNLIHAQGYIQDLLDLVQCYQQEYSPIIGEIPEKIEAIDLAFLKEDLPKLLDSMQVGAKCIHEIVQSLRNFSRLDESEIKAVDIHEGIDSTLMILKSRLAATKKISKIELFKEYSSLPLVECYPGQLNQVFMNILVNAIDSLEEQFSTQKLENQPFLTHKPWIRICTEVIDDSWVIIRIADNGQGMTAEQSSKLFDPFFTTKPVGKGTGLGLSISYQIVVERHGGQIYSISEPNQGAEFIIKIPRWQSIPKTAIER
ncbi:MAG: ATP-binding protein [Cyanobacteriota bacterium]